MITHNAEYPFVCGTCGKPLKMKDALQQHLLNHTGDKEHKLGNCGDKVHNCKACGKSFRYKSTLEIHAPIHMEDKPNNDETHQLYTCGTCGKSFIYATHLVEHYYCCSSN